MNQFEAGPHKVEKIKLINDRLKAAEECIEIVRDTMVNAELYESSISMVNAVIKSLERTVFDMEKRNMISDYDKWLIEVDKIVIERTGMGMNDFEDYSWYDEFGSGIEPADSVREFLLYINWEI